ncbi:MAG: hypothetical protein P4M13_00515 [Alphaproteobacteria bacterium]|nr:hypothetical protein [Alphaproteobacteria bacterium]
MAARLTQSETASIRFWNMKSAGVFVAAVFALAAALSLQNGLAAVLCAAAYPLERCGLVIVPVAFLGVYCIQAAFVLLTGVVLIEGEIRFPRIILANLPFFVSGRVRRAIGDLDAITYVGHFFGIEWVRLRFGDCRYLVPFSSRERRLAFFRVVQAKKTGVRLYRAV